MAWWLQMWGSPDDKIEWRAWKLVQQNETVSVSFCLRPALRAQLSPAIPSLFPSCPTQLVRDHGHCKSFLSYP